MTRRRNHHARYGGLSGSYETQRRDGLTTVCLAGRSTVVEAGILFRPTTERPVYRPVQRCEGLRCSVVKELGARLSPQHQNASTLVNVSSDTTDLWAGRYLAPARARFES